MGHRFLYRTLVWGCLWLLSAGVFAALPTYTAVSDPPPTSAIQSANTYWLLRIDGAIGPGVSDHIQRTLSAAAQQPSPPQFVLITLDTPGGLDASLRDINQAVLASVVPVVMFVAPQGARAASAGTFMLYAAHVAAMAPATSLGAATPVQISGPGGAPSRPKPTPQNTPDDAGADDTDPPADNSNQASLRNKQINDAVAYIRGLATLRQRNVEFAEQAVLSAATLTAEEALAQNVIEFVAQDVADLLQQLDGHDIPMPGHTAANGNFTFQTPGLIEQEQVPDWRNQLLSTITDPNVAYILMLLGVYGLLLEFYSPGFGVSGIIGAICLLLALLAFQMLPINGAGLALLLLGIALLLGEALVPSFGALGFGGVVAFVLGSIMLIDDAQQVFQIALPVIAAFAMTSVLVMVVVVRLLLKLRHKHTVIGSEALLRETAIVKQDFSQEGEVWLQGELWHALSEEPLQAGQQVQVIARNGLVVTVAPLSEPVTTTTERNGGF